MKKIKLLFLLLIAIPATQVFSQDLCKGGPAKGNRKVEMKVYKCVTDLQNSKLKDTTIQRLKKEYSDLQDKFNDLFKKMSEDLNLFTKKERVCEKYGGDLKDLVAKADSYTNTAFEALGKSKPASVGADDIIMIIKLLDTVVTELTTIRQNSFYNRVKWADWEGVPDDYKKLKAK
ncbi:hypothetical protein [Chitinophaga sp. Ak27]|uniref:hypothetical protein n=1 Tax=Chitinophaga sp. Ak27 TaxID=2726116 RepID=UPI00145CC766|nr:hypothetical protein [Chitinophaga sp. Ak27]NLU94861.1 hypothetical protein [Chitinophaga sp. Ak27]